MSVKSAAFMSVIAISGSQLDASTLAPTHPGGEFFSFAGVPNAGLERAKRIRGGSGTCREIELLSTV